jgi:hypothetical protein
MILTPPTITVVTVVIIIIIIIIIIIMQPGAALVAPLTALNEVGCVGVPGVIATGVIV